MNKEILEITKKFHDTYEKLSKEYGYETREDTKVFNVNSNNGKLMYVTVNEVVGPILEENQQLKQWDVNKDTRNSRQRVANAKLIKENQKLKERLSGTTFCYDEEEHQRLKEESIELKKQLHEASLEIQYMIERDLLCPSICNKLEKIISKQKEFIKYLQEEINVQIQEESIGCEITNKRYILEEILQTYKDLVNETEQQ